MTARAGLAASLVLALISGGVMIFVTGPQIEAGGEVMFDTRLAGYGLDEARAVLASLTQEGRAVYLGAQRLADTAFPLSLTGALVLATAESLRGAGRWGLGLAVLPALAYLALDLAENAAVAGLVRAGADGITEADVARASALTVWKFILVGTAGLVLLAALARRFALRRQP